MSDEKLEQNAPLEGEDTSIVVCSANDLEGGKGDEE